MPCEPCQNKIAGLEKENRKLRIEIRDIKNKLFHKNKEVNRMHRDNFESVDVS